MSEQRKAIFYLLAAAILWSLGGLLIKMVAWNALAIAGMRSAIAFVFLLLFLRRPRFVWSAAQIGGGIAYAATVTLFVMANKSTTAANAILLQYTAPVYIALFGAWFLDERADRGDWLTIVLTLGGMTLFFVDDLSTGNLLGNIYAVSSGVSFAWLVLFLRRQKAESPVESILLGNAITALIGLPFMLKTMPDAGSWAGLLLLGVFQLGLPYLLYSRAIKHVNALEAIIIPIVEPILNPLWVLLLLGETPGFWSLIGGIIVLGAVTTRAMLKIIGKNLPFQK